MKVLSDSEQRRKHCVPPALSHESQGPPRAKSNYSHAKNDSFTFTAIDCSDGKLGRFHIPHLYSPTFAHSLAARSFIQVCILCTATFSWLVGKKKNISQIYSN